MPKYSKNKKPSMSTGERAVAAVLDQIGLDYEYDKTYPGLLNEKGNKMRFDFLVKIKGKTVVIEYDGEHHYAPVRYGEKDKTSQERYERSKIADTIKNEFCEYHDIRILRIPYFDLKNAVEIVRSFLGSYDLPVYMKSTEHSKVIHMFKQIRHRK